MAAMAPEVEAVDHHFRRAALANGLGRYHRVCLPAVFRERRFGARQRDRSAGAAEQAAGNIAFEIFATGPAMVGPRHRCVGDGKLARSDFTFKTRAAHVGDQQLPGGAPERNQPAVAIDQDIGRCRQRDGQEADCNGNDAGVAEPRPSGDQLKPAERHRRQSRRRHRRHQRHGA
jgi:hypothetical protein